MKKLILILLLLTLASCGHSLKQGWSNFSAYYNTFYNARKDFRAGLKKERQQPVTLDASTPFRVYPAPLSAGSDDFAQAIENGNQVLRHHARSKWTDNALLLIGKSHYYRREFFPAIQQFESLLAFPGQTSLKQKAVIWKGRTLYEIASYSKAVQFLKGSLTEFGDTWKPANRAEAQVVLAEHLAMLGESKEAAGELQSAIPGLGDKPLKGRAYLLLGQMLQKNQRYDAAFRAYEHVKPNHPRYVYVYQAELRRAMVARLSGRAGRAADIYQAMLNDEKNFRNRDEINYHLAGAYRELGKFDQARKLYQKVLQNKGSNAISPRIISQTYYHLGRLYSNHYHNYQTAAAYYDSSSSGTPRQTTNDEETEQLASAYTRYSALRQKIKRADSLLKLGSLSAKALDARLARIRKNRKQEIENSGNAVQTTNNKLTNAGARDVYKTTTKPTNAAQFGFLDYHNVRRVRRDRQKFIAIWGARPLVDNWRRAAAITADVTNNQGSVKKQQAEETGRGALTDKQLGIDLGEIPRSPQSRRALRHQQYRAEYELGSLFFLTLNQPDSARRYYRHVLARRAPADLRARALYAMYQLNHLHEKTDSAAVYKQKILRQFPNTVYARRIRGHANMPQHSAADSTEQLRARFQRLLASRPADPPDPSRAAQLRRLALNHQTSPLAPAIYYRGIQAYIRFARARDSTQIAADSLRVIRADRAQQASYSGPDWDRLRRWLTDFVQRFPQAPQRSQVEIWARFLRRPAVHTTVYSCKELHVKPRIVGGKQRFVQSVKLPQKVKKRHLSGTLRYRLIIGKDGRVQSYKLLSPPSHLGLEPAYEKAIKDRLEFKPITKSGRPVRAACEVAFPIKQ